MRRPANRKYGSASRVASWGPSGPCRGPKQPLLGPHAAPLRLLGPQRPRLGPIKAQLGPQQALPGTQQTLLESQQILLGPQQGLLGPQQNAQWLAPMRLYSAQKNNVILHGALCHMRSRSGWHSGSHQGAL